MVELLARIRWRLPEEGGRVSRIPPGVTSNYNAGGSLTYCLVYPVADVSVMPPGEVVDVRIRLPWGSLPPYRVHLAPGAPVTLQEGAQIVATGVVTGVRDTT